MDQKEKDIVFSERVKAGKRIYYLDVKQTRGGDHYIAITESKRVIENPAADFPNISFEKHKIFLYKEDLLKFQSALDSVINYIADHQDISPRQDTYTEAADTLGNHIDLDIEF